MNKELLTKNHYLFGLVLLKSFNDPNKGETMWCKKVDWNNVL